MNTCQLITEKIQHTTIAVLVLTITISTPINAYNMFYMDNGIFAYDSGSEVCGPSGSGGSGIEGNDNAERILRFFVGKGLSLAAASGFVGNMQAESTLRPDIIQGGATAPANYVPVHGVGFGLVQWTFNPRQQPLVDLAGETNRDIIDLELQLDYVWQELNGAYKATLNTLARYHTNLTPTQAAVIIHGKTNATKNDPRFAIAPGVGQGYEASADSANDVIKNRGGVAEATYKKFRNTIADGSGVAGADNVLASSEGSGTCSSTFPVAGCTTTSALYGAGTGNGQLTRDQLISIYGDPPSVSRNLTSVDFLGKSVTVHNKVAGCLAAVISDIKQSGVSYQIDAIGGYRIDGSGFGQIGERSYHNYGIAIDINPDDNPFTNNPPAITRYTMPPEYVRAFKGRGWSWGGDWSGPWDYMHFEYNGIGPGGNVNDTQWDNLPRGF